MKVLARVKWLVGKLHMEGLEPSAVVLSPRDYTALKRECASEVGVPVPKGGVVKEQVLGIPLQPGRKSGVLVGLRKDRP